MNKFVLLPLIVFPTSGCALTLPNTIDYYGTRQKPYTAADAAAGGGGLGLDADAERCAGRISSLKSKANAERAASTILSIVGGSVSLSSGFISAFATDDDAKKATAVTAAVGGLVSIIVPLTGNAGQTVNQLRESLDNWNKADVEMVVAAKLAGIEKDAALVQIKKYLQACGN